MRYLASVCFILGQFWVDWLGFTK